MEESGAPKSSEIDVKEPIELVKEVKKELAEYRRPLEKSWREYDNAYYGKQHKTGESKKSVKNIVFKIIEGEVPILTDSMPSTHVDAEIADKQGDADTLNKAIKYVYQDQNLPLVLPTLVRSSLISAPGYLYAYYNPDADGGDGKIEYRQLPWEYVYLDGNAQTIEQSDKAHIEIPMRREAIARMWPEKREEILGLSSRQDTTSFGDSDNFEDRDISGLESSMGKPSRHKAKDIVKYAETWLKSYDLEDIPQEDTLEEIERERAQFLAKDVPNIGRWENHDAHDAAHAQQRAEVLAQFGLPGDAPFEQLSAMVEQLLAQNPEAQDIGIALLTVKMIDNHREEHAELKKINPSGQRPKYKDGWRVIKSVESVVLYDGPNPEMGPDGVGHIPLVPFYGYKDDTIYGFGEVKNIIDPQRSLNDMDQRELDNLKVNSNSGWLADHEAQVKEGSLTNEPGIVVIKKKGTEVRRLEPGTVSPQLANRKQLDEMSMEEISGMNEATQGQLPSSGASGVTVQKLQTQAIGRIRLKDRYLQHYSMRRLAIITAQLIINHWTTEKQFRLRTDDSKIEDVVFDPIRMQDLGYSIGISPGSMAGLDRDALNAFYLQLFQVSGGAMTFEDLLMVSDFPKREMLLVKVQERNQLQQSLEELQAEMAALQEQNASLIGLVNPHILEGDQRKVFEMASKQALMEKVMSQPQPEIQGNPGVDQGQPENQGMM
jgi:hypothetical protein